MLEPSLHNDLVELISSNLTTTAITHVGRLIFSNYDSSVLSGKGRHVTVSCRSNAELLVGLAEQTRKTCELIKLLVELDDRPVLGKRVRIKEIEGFLHRLTQHGYVYDPRSRVVRDCVEDGALLPNWGSLRSGRIYDITAQYGVRRMEQFYYQLRLFLSARLRTYDGRIWTWAGDGGICAFTFRGHADRAALCALELQSNMPVFNMRLPNPIEEAIEVRVGMDTGKVKFLSDTGQIVSDTVNYAAHLEKRAALPGTVAISGDLLAALVPRIRKVFRNGGTFEGRAYAVTYKRLDDLFASVPPPPRARGRVSSS
jgi:hypothetical protein